MSGQPATLTFSNGQTISGKIRVNTFDNYSSIREVAFAEGTSKIYKIFTLSEIQYLYLNGSNYSVKNLKGNEMWGGNALRFVKELTPLNGNLQLFENETLVKNTDGSLHREVQLFVQIPGNSIDIFNAQSDKFIPNFDEKVALYLRDCPSLYEKIHNKEKDYFYAFVNQGETRRRQVWMNIVNAYNQCH